jgi:hypothetical protein
MASIIFHFILNFGFIFIHAKGIQTKPTPQYRQLKRDFTYSYYFCNVLTYIFNFKIALFQISYFGGRVRYAGRFSSDNWQ